MAIAMMEEERKRRMSEDPNSPAMLQQQSLTRQESQKAAIQMMEKNELLRVGEEIEEEATANLQRRKSIETVKTLTEKERARRINPNSVSYFPAVLCCKGHGPDGPTRPDL